MRRIDYKLYNTGEDKTYTPRKELIEPITKSDGRIFQIVAKNGYGKTFLLNLMAFAIEHYSRKATTLDLKPRARVVDTCLVGVDPVLMLTGPIDATRRLLDRNGLGIGDIDTFEINEAFASVVLAWARELGADLDRTNPNGGAIALGHPLGATGGVLLTKALSELERTGGRFGLVSMCCGGGLGTGTLIERL